MPLRQFQFIANLLCGPRQSRGIGREGGRGLLQFGFPIGQFVDRFGRPALVLGERLHGQQQAIAFSGDAPCLSEFRVALQFGFSSSCRPFLVHAPCLFLLCFRQFTGAGLTLTASLVGQLLKFFSRRTSGNRLGRGDIRKNDRVGACRDRCGCLFLSCGRLFRKLPLVDFLRHCDEQQDQRAHRADQNGQKREQRDRVVGRFTATHDGSERSPGSQAFCGKGTSRRDTAAML